jgi:hypothetical protein
LFNNHVGWTTEIIYVNKAGHVYITFHTGLDGKHNHLCSFQLEKYFDFSLYSHHFSLLSLTSLLSAPEREVTSPSDFKVVGTLQ